MSPQVMNTFLAFTFNHPALLVAPTCGVALTMVVLRFKRHRENTGFFRATVVWRTRPITCTA
ncbi:protein of unknown function [Pararobbsia alpina]